MKVDIIKTKDVIDANNNYLLDLISNLCYYYAENVIKFQHMMLICTEKKVCWDVNRI